MSVTKEQVMEALRRIKGPDLESNIVDLGMVSEVLMRDDRAYFSITIPAQRAKELEPLRQAAAKVVGDLEGVEGVTAVLTAEAEEGGAAPSQPQAAQPAASSGNNVHEHPRVQEARERMKAGKGAAGGAAPQAAGGQQQAGERPQAQGIPGAKHLIAVASGKGGVGKSTTAVNLALGFKAFGLKAGILDADIYGPSQPKLLGLTGRPLPKGDGSNTLNPMEGYGIEVMSMGFMVEEGTPVIWRGPMVVQALNQMLRDVDWGNLDVLIIDMPPGTGDVQLTMAQQVPLSGAVIVSTPQDLALIDARKGLNMFKKVDIPVLGIIENMSYFLCPSCGERSDIFGNGGAKDEAEKLSVPFLGSIPLHMDIREKSDAGQPITATEPESEHAALYRELAGKTWEELKAAEGSPILPPELVVSDDMSALKVTFADGTSYDLSAEMLRVMSPSAEVQGHAPSQRVTVGGKQNVAITELQPVGNYAVRIVFSDGHATGLFVWDYLETLGREKETRWANYEAELAEKGLSRS